MALRPRLEPPSRRQKTIAVLMGIFVFLYIASCLITKAYGVSLFSIPFFVGAVAGLLYPEGPFRAAMYALLGSLCLAIVTLQEGVVCVLFSIPVLLPMLWVGSFAGSVAQRHIRTKRGRDGTVGLMIFISFCWQVWARVTDDPSHHPIHAAETEVAIAAPPDAVFATLTTRELRVESRWPWFIRIGLPMPDRMVVERGGLGGQARFEFSQGTAFARITKWHPGHELAYTVDRYDIRDLPFHITRLGRGPDYGFRSERVEDWLTVLDTRYTLTASGDGGTLLRRRILWQRHLAPDVYFGWLQQTVMERGQLRLLELIGSRVEGSLPKRSDRQNGPAFEAVTPAMRQL